MPIATPSIIAWNERAINAIMALNEDVMFCLSSGHSSSLSLCLSKMSVPWSLTVVDDNLTEVSSMWEMAIEDLDLEPLGTGMPWAIKKKKYNK